MTETHHPAGESSTVSQRSIKQLLWRWTAAVAGVNLPQPPAYDGPDVQLSRLVEHTDDVGPGAAFVARVRATSDGHIYAAKAASLGAALIVGQKPRAALDPPLPQDSNDWQVEDTAVTLSWLAAAWEDFPGRQLVVIGVTGTDGKTTTANFLYQILRAAGHRAGLLSTVRAVIGEKEEPLALHVTTPEAPVVQRYLRRMCDAGLTHCVLEATSHALAQRRVDSVDFDVAVVTNITHEHLDYHGDYDAYFAAKARLVQMLQNDSWALPTRNRYKFTLSKTAVLNRDDQSYTLLADIPVTVRLSYGMQDAADVVAHDLRFQADATRFSLNLGVENVEITSPFMGRFNVYNMAAAATAARALHISGANVKAGLESLRSLTGRMERIDEGQSFLTVVDFAHTPNGLRKAIAAARGMTDGKVITVFGSAGKRDVAKRRLMAEISAQDADYTVLTAEDPRTESLDEILAAMAAGCREQEAEEGETFWRVRDRGRAIYFALSLAGPEDLVLICGKGHEQSMCFGVTEYPWDDPRATRRALRALLQGQPPPDSGLPTFEEEAEGDLL
ncbi:MAG TPA: UDP-N-acetylmuramoyl-L-alanyl-D-glutamate--2,6-diaminopimelate ligase [Candidatus Sulfomarinibacteraceae bacterium]|nr:UDP-N-acetylmuramoyl-L-alanyl-D-glutamate--2,6-diaminopimelate ligase [Candidatus Sulfomarinibacteraceae bacterium]